MIFLFIKSDLIRSQPLVGHPCPNCGKTDGLVMELRQQYAEFADTPVYPEKVFGVVHCQQCEQAIPASRWTDDLHRAYVTLKTGYKTPRQYWRGAIRTATGFVVGLVLLIVVLNVWGHFQKIDIDKQQATEKQTFEHPMPGLTLAGGTGSGTSGFGVWRVSRVSDGTVWLKTYTGSRVLTNFYTETGWSDLPDSDFADEAVGYSVTKFRDKCLMRPEAVGDYTKHCEFTVFALLDK